MGTNEVKHIIENVLGNSTNQSDYIKQMLAELQNSDCDLITKQLKSIELWAHLKRTPVIPDDLNSDDDLFLCQLLADICEEYEDVEALSVAFVVMSHRYLLGDPLEKAFVCSLAMSILYKNMKSVFALLNYFLNNTEDSPFYRRVLEDDENLNSLYREMIRAIGPHLLWMKSNYPDYNPYGLEGDIESMIGQIDQESEGKKPAMPKFIAVCRFYYEQFYLEN